MVRIIPALLVNDIDAFKTRLKQVEKLVPLVQIDVTDGKFAPFTDFADPEEIKNVPTSTAYEVHLMDLNPLRAVEPWLKIPQVKRVIFHIEAGGEPQKVIAKIRQAGRKAGIALNPETAEKKVAPLLSQVDFVLVLGVTPGASGQPFQKSVLKKIIALRKLAPRLEIEVDGGMDGGTIKEAHKAGATSFAAANAIWGSGDPQENLKQLQQIQV